MGIGNRLRGDNGSGRKTLPAIHSLAWERSSLRMGPLVEDFQRRAYVVIPQRLSIRSFTTQR